MRVEKGGGGHEKPVDSTSDIILSFIIVIVADMFCFGAPGSLCNLDFTILDIRLIGHL